MVDRMKKVKGEKWPALSVVLLFSNMTLCFVIFPVLKLNFNIYYTIVIINLVVIPAIFLYLEFTGTREKLWAKWKSVPTIIHIIICGICILGGFFLLYTTFPGMKKIYEKN